MALDLNNKPKIPYLPRRSARRQVQEVRSGARGGALDVDPSQIVLGEAQFLKLTTHIKKRQCIHIDWPVTECTKRLLISPLYNTRRHRSIDRVFCAVCCHYAVVAPRTS
jgi:hypothetical protein